MNHQKSGNRNLRVFLEDLYLASYEMAGNRTTIQMAYDSMHGSLTPIYQSTHRSCSRRKSQNQLIRDKEEPKHFSKLATETIRKYGSTKYNEKTATRSLETTAPFILRGFFFFVFLRATCTRRDETLTGREHRRSPCNTMYFRTKCLKRSRGHRQETAL